ncbi:MAG: hypothetical protein KAJ07_00465 [Planctomycetes bacterium]|nr:hypothetical protein [Planctomycetota bacterium]
MATARDLIKLAFGALTLQAAGDDVDPNDEADALTILNMMLGTWGNKRTRILSSVKEGFTLTIGQTTYTIGTGGDFSTERPVKIEKAFVRDSNNQDHPVKIIVDRAEYEGIIDKNISARPYKLYFERVFDSSRGNILLNRAPDTAETLFLIMWKPFTTFSLATDVVVLPNGYEEAIYTQLAIRLAPHFGKTVSQELATIAGDAVGAIDKVNLEVPIVRPDAPRGTGDGNYYDRVDVRSDT